jgi:predicted RNA binding protein YcfA (HicA-like mRNA interferase family)
VRSSEILRILRADGWLEVKQTGSHTQLRHSFKPGLVIVPFHGKDLGKLAYSILKQAGLR